MTVQEKLDIFVSLIQGWSQRMNMSTAEFSVLDSELHDNETLLCLGMITPCLKLTVHIQCFKSYATRIAFQLWFLEEADLLMDSWISEIPTALCSSIQTDMHIRRSLHQSWYDSLKGRLQRHRLPICCVET